MNNEDVPAAALTQKLYSPISVELGAYDDDGVYYNETISQENAVDYAPKIQEALLNERLPEEERRGLMEYYSGDGEDEDGDNGGAIGKSVDEKVISAFVDVDVQDDKLRCVATLTLTEPLTPGELNALKDFLTGQYSDGFGEGFEQRPVKIGNENTELFVHLWQSGDGFFIETEQGLEERLAAVTPPVAQKAQAEQGAETETIGGYTSVMDKINEGKAAMLARQNERKDAPSVGSKRKSHDEEL